MKTNKKIVVLYHKGCRDGFGAAWTAWRKFGRKASYLGVNHDDSLPKMIKGKVIYLLDFSYPIDKTLELVKSAKKAISIDHHISAEKSIKMAHDYSYNLSHSGAALSWKYFHPNRKIPKLLKYIEDRDIWKLSLPNTRELAASLETYEFNFSLWNKIAKDWERSSSRRKYLVEGMAILKYQKELIRKALRDAEEVRLLGKRALAANSVLSLNSDIGDAMRKRGYSLGIIWQKKGDNIIVSLRSANKVDASKIAAHFGGGGQRYAAAFRLPITQKFPWKKIKS